MNQDFAGTNFTFVARSLRCDFEDAAAELECMRRVPMPRIENFIGQYQDNQTLVNASQPTISFTRQGRSIFDCVTKSRESDRSAVDNKTVFSDYPARYQNGQVAQIPKMLGATSREASLLVPYPINNLTAGLSEDRILTQTLATVCAAYITSVYRDQADLATYLYEWAGNFSNIAPIRWLGAYHYSDSYMFFGTYYITLGKTTELERQTSARMQDLLYDFVADPDSLPENGWPEYQATGGNGGRLARFGADGQVLQLVHGDEVDGACHIPGATYNTSP